MNPKTGKGTMLADDAAVPPPRANWGARETPRKCPYCGSESSTVTHAYINAFDTRIRHRECGACARKFNTREAWLPDEKPLCAAQ